MTKYQALKLALMALKKCRYRSLADEIVDPAITAINEALAQPEHHDPIGDAQGRLIAEQAAEHPPRKMTPDMMRKVQMHSELGEYAAANLVGAYDLFQEFWRVAMSAAPQPAPQPAQHKPLTGEIKTEIVSSEDGSFTITDAHSTADIVRWLLTQDDKETIQFLLDEENVDRARADEREQVAAWMMQRGYATGHGDTVEDLLKEIEWQIRESEREACAKVCDELFADLPPYTAPDCAAAIRARGDDAP